MGSPAQSTSFSRFIHKGKPRHFHGDARIDLLFPHLIHINKPLILHRTYRKRGRKRTIPVMRDE